MILKDLPGGGLYQEDGGAYVNEATARRHEAIHRQLAAGVDAQVGEAAAGVIAEAATEANRAEAAAKDAAASLATVTWRDRGTLTAGQDAATLPAETGVWRIMSSSVVADMTGLPVQRAGVLVQTMAGAGVGYRTYATYGIAGPSSGVWLSMRESTTAWGPWVKLGAPSTILGTVPAGSNVDTWTTPGQALVRNGEDATTITGLPVQWPGVLTHSQPLPSSPLATQHYAVYGAQAGLWWRVSSNVSGGWTPWKRLDAPDPATTTRDLGLEHTVRRADMIRRRAVQVTTPAVLVMVFDHGLAVVRDTLHQLMAERGLPYTLAINPGRMGTHDNTGVTWDDVKTLVSSGLVEPGNHSWSHTGATDIAGYAHEIEDSRREIETRLGVPVDTWVQPGNSFGDFTTSGDVNLYHSTEAGRLIVGTHGAVTGTTGTGTHRLGSPLLGAGGTWIDAAGSTAGMLAGIDATVASGGVRIVRHHPQYLGTSGHLPVSEMTSFLDAVVQRRDAGKLTVLPFASAAAATDASTRVQFVDNGDGTGTIQIGA